MTFNDIKCSLDCFMDIVILVKEMLRGDFKQQQQTSLFIFLFISREEKYRKYVLKLYNTVVRRYNYSYTSQLLSYDTTITR